MSRTAIALAVLLAIEVAALAVRRGAGEEGSAAAARKAPIFPGLTLEEVAHVRVADRDGASVEIARGDGGWVIESAGRYPAKAEKVEQLISKIAGLQSSGIAATSPSSHAGLEVAERFFQREVRLLDAAGKERARLFAGRAVAGGCFVRRAGEAAVHRVAEPLQWQISPQAQSYIDPKIVKLDPGKARGLAIRRAGKTVVALEKGEGGAWRATEPETFDADKAKVEQVLRALAGAYAAAPAGAKAAPEQGLDGEQALTVEALLEGDEKAGLTIGAKTAAAGQARRYARPLGSEAVAEIAETTAAALEKDAFFFKPAPPPPPEGNK
jgi:hypothetical protein